MTWTRSSRTPLAWRRSTGPARCAHRSRRSPRGSTGDGHGRPARSRRPCGRRPTLRSPGSAAARRRTPGSGPPGRGPRRAPSPRTSGRPGGAAVGSPPGRTPRTPPLHASDPAPCSGNELSPTKGCTAGVASVVTPSSCRRGSSARSGSASRWNDLLVTNRTFQRPDLAVGDQTATPPDVAGVPVALDQGWVMRATSSASSSCASVRTPFSTKPISTTTSRIVFSSASAFLATLAAFS